MGFLFRTEEEGGISKRRLSSLFLSAGGILTLIAQYWTGTISLETMWVGLLPFFLGIMGYGIAGKQDRDSEKK